MSATLSKAYCEWRNEPDFSALDHVANVLSTGELQALSDLIVKALRKVPGDVEHRQWVDILTSVEQLANRIHDRCQCVETGACADDLAGALIEAEKSLPVHLKTLEEIDGDEADLIRTLLAN